MFRFWGMKSAILVLCALIAVALPACAAVEDRRAGNCPGRGGRWTGYVLAGYAPQLYGYSDQRFDWVPVVASDFPTDLKKETIDGDEFGPPKFVEERNPLERRRGAHSRRRRFPP